MDEKGHDGQRIHNGQQGNEGFEVHRGVLLRCLLVQREERSR